MDTRSSARETVSVSARTMMIIRSQLSYVRSLSLLLAAQIGKVKEPPELLRYKMKSRTHCTGYCVRAHCSGRALVTLNKSPILTRACAHFTLSNRIRPSVSLSRVGLAVDMERTEIQAAAAVRGALFRKLLSFSAPKARRSLKVSCERSQSRRSK